MIFHFVYLIYICCLFFSSRNIRTNVLILYLFCSNNSLPICGSFSLSLSYFIFLIILSFFFLFFINIRNAGGVLPRNRKRERRPCVYGGADTTCPTQCTPEEMYEVDTLHTLLEIENTHRNTFFYFSVVCLLHTHSLTLIRQFSSIIDLSLFLFLSLFLPFSLSLSFLPSLSGNSLCTISFVKCNFIGIFLYSLRLSFIAFHIYIIPPLRKSVSLLKFPRLSRY